MSKPKYWESAKKFFNKKDKILSKIIKKYPSHLKSRKDPFFHCANQLLDSRFL